MPLRRLVEAAAIALMLTAATAVAASSATLKSQTITFNPPTSLTGAQTPYVLTATASSGLPVTITSSTPAVCTVSGFTLTLAAAGTCTLTASQTGNSVFAAAKPVTKSIKVTKAAQTISFIPPTSLTGAQNPFAVSASATSKLAVTITSGTATVCTVNGFVVSLLKAGTCTLTANQAGNALWSPAKAVTKSISVTKATQTISFTVPPLTMLQSPYPVAPTTTSSLPATVSTGTPTICQMGTQGEVVLLKKGTCSLTATQSGDPLWSAASPVTVSVPVTQVPQSITYDPLPNRTYGGEPVYPNAVASSGLQVEFISATPGICSYNGNSVDLLLAGTCTITAVQLGDEVYEPAPQVSRSFLIRKALLIASAPTLDVSYLSPVPKLAPAYSGFVNGESDQDYNFTRSLIPPICSTTYVAGSTAGSAYSTSCAGGTALNYEFFYQSGLIFVQRIEQSIDFPEIAWKTYGAAPFPIGATASSGLSVSVTSATPQVCSIADKMIRILGAGWCQLTASQSGNGGYTPAEDVVREFPVEKAWLTVTVQPTTVYFGALEPTLLPLYSGFQNGETANSASFRAGLVPPTCTADYTMWMLPGEVASARCEGGQSANYEFFSDYGGLPVVTVVPAIPQAPTGATAEVLSDSIVRVSFNTVPFTGSFGLTYTVRAFPNGPAVSIPETGEARISVEFYDLDPNSMFSFAVTASNESGTSTASEPTNAVRSGFCVGCIGPGGGVIFYDAGSTQPWGRYLELAPSNWYESLMYYGYPDYWGYQRPWSGVYATSETYVGGTLSDYGAGSANTDRILGAIPNSDSAAALARAYSGLYGESAGEWSLPSIEELVAASGWMGYYNSSQGCYWSSTEYGQFQAWAAWPGYGSPGGATIVKKNYSCWVWPVRAFGPDGLSVSR